MFQRNLSYIDYYADRICRKNMQLPVGTANGSTTLPVSIQTKRVPCSTAGWLICSFTRGVQITMSSSASRTSLCGKSEGLELISLCRLTNVWQIGCTHIKLSRSLLHVVLHYHAHSTVTLYQHFIHTSRHPKGKYIIRRLDGAAGF